MGCFLQRGGAGTWSLVPAITVHYVAWLVPHTGIPSFLLHDSRIHSQDRPSANELHYREPLCDARAAPLITSS